MGQDHASTGGYRGPVTMTAAARWGWPIAYCLLIPFVNWTFSIVRTPVPAPWGGDWTPLFITGPGGFEWTPITIVTGLVLVFRDFAQRAVGHWVLAVMLLGLALTIPVTGFTADNRALIAQGSPLPDIFWAVVTAGGGLAAASGAAFLISELADWAVFTFTGRPLHERIMLSSLIGAPLDSAVFLYGAAVLTGLDLFNAWNVAASVAGKLFAAWLVAEIVRRRMSSAPA